MLRSLFSGISGLRSHQTMMDVVGNNIANVNSVGYKSSNVVFEDTLTQQLRAAGAPQAGDAGINPAQVGLGVKLAGITTNFSQGAAQLTGRNTDLMIQGDGFFVVKDAGQDLYTRAGAFSLDAQGRLATPDGGVVQGWAAVNGVLSTNAAPTDVTLPIGTLLPPVQTTNVAMGGNLPAATDVTKPLVSALTTYDSQGKSHALSATFTRTGSNTWTVAVSEDGTAIGTPTALTFDAAGALTSAPTLSLGLPSGATATLDISKLTQYGGANTLGSTLSQDGSGMGSLQSFNISPDGVVIGVFSNGLKQPLAQLALATFNNPPGLEKVGNSSYRGTVNSGTAQLGTAASGGRGLLAGGAVEMSNVDLAAEFTNLIVAQRGFQANSRIITSSDEILQDLVNLKR